MPDTDLSRADLRELWGRNKHRPAFIREHRDAIATHTNLDESPPESDSLFQMREWLDRYMGTVTRQLAETTTDDDAEAEGE